MRHRKRLEILLFERDSLELVGESAIGSLRTSELHRDLRSVIVLLDFDEAIERAAQSGIADRRGRRIAVPGDQLAGDRALFAELVGELDVRVSARGVSGVSQPLQNRERVVEPVELVGQERRELPRQIRELDLVPLDLDESRKQHCETRPVLGFFREVGEARKGVEILGVEPIYDLEGRDRFGVVGECSLVQIGEAARDDQLVFDGLGDG